MSMKCLLPTIPNTTKTPSQEPCHANPRCRDAGLEDQPDALPDIPLDNKPEQEEEEAGGSKKKGKEKDSKFTYGTGPLKGSLPPSCWADPVARNPERWSLPGALDQYDLDSKPPNPMDTMGNNMPWLNCKPDLIRKPLPFKGEADDIDWFITNCEICFQVHSAYLWLDPYRVAFASSYFKGLAKEWWILELADLRSATWGKFRFPLWYFFTEAIHEKFKDPAVEDKQKAKMYALCMTRSMTATEYFQELEKFVKKAKL
ncbi:uncharacterized protein ARMOST_11772 [Armillaria ostoyae]|uniref:Retrotransposon gag domain-containing protein n=1 Tax=Armillaria ostoyae TaxID=47428 RepID=A0A284RI25_ARMOS|nr:uncharacterized protein ARMOST_11772 [Armillaria ostoyae]